MTKDCTGYQGGAGDTCTITSSSLHAITAGSTVVYLDAVVDGTLNSDIVLDGPGNNNAYGHVTLDLSTGRGTVTFTGGTGVYTHFEARADVTPEGGPVFAWDGEYRFSPN